MSDARTLRQRLVAEIGFDGQMKIGRTKAKAGCETSARYLACAGFSSLAVPSEAIAEKVRAAAPDVHVIVDPSMATPADPPPPIAIDPSVAPVFHGSIRALRALREAVQTA